MPGGISFSAVYYDKSQKRIVRYLKKEADALSNFLSENRHVAKKSLLLCNEVNATVPSPFFMPEQKEELFGLTATKNPEERLVHDEMLFDKAVNIFPINEGVEKLAAANGFKVRSCFTLFYDIVITLFKRDNKHPVVLAGIFNGFFYLFMMQDSKVFVANSFRYSGINDFLYHILNLYDKYLLDKKQTDMFVIKNYGYDMEELKAILRTYGIKKLVRLSDIPQDFLSYKLTTLKVPEMYLFYKFLSFEDNRR